MKKFYLSGSFCLILGFFMVSLQLQGAWLSNVPITVNQPDGTELQLFMTGDEYHLRVHDANQFTITRDALSGYFVYADLVGEEIVPTGLVVGQADPALAGLQPGIDITPEAWKQLREEFWADSPPKQVLPGYTEAVSSNFGTLNNLVVFIRFSDQADFPDNQPLYNGMFNDQAPGANSMINYFREVSYNSIDIPTFFFPTAASPAILSYQDAFPRAYYMPYDAVTNPDGYDGQSERTNREHSLLANAVNYIAAAVTGINIDHDGDGRVDNICFITRGGTTAWSTLLWPHRWTLHSQPAYINGLQVWDYNFQLEDHLTSHGNGVLCHEMFHTLGAPDLYHYTSNGISPVGEWDLMDNNTNPPQHMGAWMKYKYGGWISSIPELTTQGTFNLNPLTSSSGQCYKITSPVNPDEFFILEYRNQSGAFESSLPGSGLLVYRINSLAGNGNAQGPPDEVYIYRPNGDLTNNGDLSQATFTSDAGRTAFNNITNPSCFLSNGDPANISLSAVGTAGSTISFLYQGNTIVEPDGWTVRYSGFNETNIGIHHMFAANDNDIWALAFDLNNWGVPSQRYTRSNDGGLTWNAAVIPGYPTSFVNMVFAFDDQHAWITMNHQAGSGVILQTTDGGTTWTPKNTAAFQLPGAFPNMIHFFNANEGFCMGDPTEGYFEIYTTIDGGENWTRVSSPDIPPPLSGEWGITHYYSVVGDHIWFGTNQGRVFRSTDKGYHWTAHDVGAGSILVDVSFRSLSHGMAIDRSTNTTGNTFETFDGGSTWSMVSKTGPYHQYEFAWIPGTPATCVSTGSAAGSMGCSISYDGGHSWEDFGGMETYPMLYTVWTDVNHGWAGGFTNGTPPVISEGMFRYHGNNLILEPDAGITHIPLPYSSASLGASEDITVTIRNRGNTVIDTLTVCYSINGSGVVCETYYPAIQPGEYVNYTFASPVDLSDETNYLIKAWTNLPDDADHTNDTSTKMVIHLPYDIPGEAVGRTRYDLQTNYSCLQRLCAFPDGTFGAAWTIGMLETAFSDRGTGYNYFDGTNWGLWPTTRIENVKTGWPSYVAWGENGEAALAHTGNTSGLVLSKRTNKNTGPWTFASLPNTPQGNNLLWPRMTSSGPDHEYLHVVSLTAPLANNGSLYNGQNGALTYSRSSDGGNTWDIFHASFPGTDASQYVGFGGDMYAFAEPKGNTLAFVYGDNWTDVFLMKSTDNGNTWSKTLIYQHPYPMFQEPVTLVTDTIWVCDRSLSVALDQNGMAHVMFGVMRVSNSDLTDATTTYWPWTDGMVYWNESRPAFTSLNPADLVLHKELVALMPDRDGNSLIELIGFGTYYTSLTSMPYMVIDENNRMMAVMASVYEDLHNGVQNYRQLQGIVSMDLGQSWSDPFDITGNNPDYQYFECVFPSLAPGTDDYLYLLFQADEEPGMAVRGDEDPYMDNFLHFLKLQKSVYLPLDVGVTAITSPVSAPGLTDQETITITVSNYSPYPVINLPVWYTIDGGPAVREVIPGPVAPLGTISYAFTQKADLSVPAHTYTITASTQITGDPDETNNQLSVQVTNIYSGNVITTIAPVMDVCAGEFLVPVLVEDFQDVASISLTLEYDPQVLDYMYYENAHPALASGMLIVNSGGTSVSLAWFSLTPVTIGDATLVAFRFAGFDGYSQLHWDTQTPGNCMYTDIMGTTLAAVFTDGMITFVNCAAIEGTLTYDNSLATPLTGTEILIMSGNTPVLSTQTDGQGTYLAQNLPAGNYNVSSNITKSWGGGNATDALKMLQHFAGQITLQGMKLAAADVDASGFVNAADALTVAKRFVNMISVMPSGDWLSDPVNVSLAENDTAVADLTAICYGDVDGSNIPALALQPGVVLTAAGALDITAAEPVSVPLHAVHAESLAALSLVIDLPDGMLEITDIEPAGILQNKGTLVWSQQHASVRLAWYSLQAVQLRPGDVIFNLVIKAFAGFNAEVQLTAGGESEAATATTRIARFEIGAPKLLISDIQGLSVRIFPNPAASSLEVEMGIPQAGKLTISMVNVTGQTVLLLEESGIPAGSLHRSIDLSGLANGTYALKTALQTHSSHMTECRKVLVNR
ncbi:MAG TPA: M6 family metalloprotease domain-containing protein [Bacteroidales bacterium]|nr:M6 family metalloprotease domain-containing protein [Bacteroidales bacterium]HSA44582.1 M6 family metalloprotease domain-containing protein [Bacteroidales bacterium]